MIQVLASPGNTLIGIAAVVNSLRQKVVRKKRTTPTMKLLPLLVVTALVSTSFLPTILAKDKKKKSTETTQEPTQQFVPKEISLPTEKGNITLIFTGFSQDSSVPDMSDAIVHLQASLRNETSFKFRSVMFELNAFDANGNNVRLCGKYTPGSGGGCDFYVFDPIEPGQTAPVTPTGGFAMIDTSRTVARGEWTIIKAPYFIKYDIQSDPVANEVFSISPSFSIHGIGLEFRNKSSDVIEVAWDQSVYIDEDANSSRLIKGNVNLAEKDRPQPNTVIPPGTKLQETVFPIDRVRQEDGKWTQEPILPELANMGQTGTTRPKDLTGKEARLFLRLLVNDQKQNVTITFKIVKMIQ
jgi:hypothetical protein